MKCTAKLSSPATASVGLAIGLFIFFSGCKPGPTSDSPSGSKPAEVAAEKPIPAPDAEELPPTVPATETVAEEKKPEPVAKKAPAANPKTAERPAAAKKSEPLPHPEPKPSLAKEPTPPSATRRESLVAPETLHKPSVLMSGEHTQTCVKKIGDQMPAVSLPDLDSKERPLTGPKDAKLTVVVFWSMNQALSREQFRRLQSETVVPFQNHGVDVVAVNVGDDPEEVRRVYREANAAFPCLIDRNKSAFTSVATDRLPRTYLLGPDGRILWMDLVYSRTTRRELANAIYYFLLEHGKSDRSS